MIQIDGSNLTVEEVIAVSRYGEKAHLSTTARERIEQSHQWVCEIIQDKKPIYGVNTGFGIFADRSIQPEEAELLNRNLILSHAVGTGPQLPNEVVRAAMLIRVNTLAIGYSGVRVELIESLLKTLNAGVTPIVPSQGSLGSSGDLAPLAHLALVITTDQKDLDDESGWAEFNGDIMTGKAAMAAAGIPRIILEPKEGLAFINGATFSAAIASLAVNDAAHLLDVAEISLSMSLEALLGVSAAFDARLHEVRHHPGQIEVAERVRKLTEGSTLIDAEDRIQDAYSLRCAPQVQGTARDALSYVQGVIKREINAVTDNPLLFGPSDVVSGGNFHGEPIGVSIDFLSIAMAEVGSISERRTFRITDSRLNYGLPPMLVDTPESAGLNSGMMMPQYTAASLVLENQTLAVPDSIHSLPTSGEQEDHNANAMTAARHSRAVLNNVARILAIEVYCSTRALDLRLRQYPGGKLGTGVGSAYDFIRNRIPYTPGDAWWGPEIDKVHEIIMTKDFTDHH